MRKWLLTLLFAAGVARLFAQDLRITGTVTDEDGTPVSGATVQVAGTANAVVSAADGSFRIAAARGQTVRITAVNAAPYSFAVDARNDYRVRLTRSVGSLDSVVVTTALGLRRSRNSLPYATQQVSAADLNRTPNTSFLNNLSGKVAGLQIQASNALGGSANVILRGRKSLTQTNQALFVIDGVPFDNTSQNTGGYDLGNPAADLNPSDIESVNVLKGAAASALYGSRAANGVVLITTRKPKPGPASLQVTLDQSIQLGSYDRSTLPKYQTEYGQGYGSAGASSPDGYFYYQPAVGSGGQPVSIVETDEDQVWGSAFNSALNVYQWDAFSPGNANFGKATPWVSAPHHEATDFLVTPVTSLTHVFLESTGPNASLKAGYGNSYDKGGLPNSQINRNDLTMSVNWLLAPKLTFSGFIDYSDERGLNRSSYDFRAANTSMRDFRQWWPTNVNLAEQKADYFRNRTNNAWNILGGYETAAADNLPKAAYHNNPYWTQYENYNNDRRQRYFGYAGLTYEIAKGLSLMGRVARDYYDQSFENRVAVGSFQTSSYSRYTGSVGETNYDLLLNYGTKLAGDLELKALLGGNVRQNQANSISAATSGGLVVPDFYALSNSVKSAAAPVENAIRKEVDGLFAGATLTFRSLVTLDATLRRDQSSTLPSDHNTYYYPAISGNFVFSRLLKDWTWLSYGKLRANYAEAGNDAPAYSTANTFNAGTPFNGQTLFTYTTTNNNPDLRPERNRTYELGLEAAFLHNRIGIDVTYYRSRLIDQIMPVIPSAASGFTLFYVNGGTVQNQGVEVSLNLVPVRTRDFDWTLQVNWSRNNNKVISLYGGQPSFTIASFQNAIQLVAETGKSTGILRGTDYQYLNGKRLIDADGYPVKATNTKSDIGNIFPDWIGGITNSFHYKNAFFSFLVDASKGGDVYSLDMDYASWSGVIPETAGKNDLGNPVRNPLASGGGLILSGVTADGKANTTRVDISDINTASNFPFGSINRIAAKTYVYDASWIKLRELAIGWSLPAAWFGPALFLKGVDVSLTGRNLWIIHKNLPYADPEQGAASTTTSSSAPIVYNPNATIGYQNAVYPSVRTFAFNVKFKF